MVDVFELQAQIDALADAVRSKPPRERHWTRDFQEHGEEGDAAPLAERVKTKGDLSRRRTIIQEDGGAAMGSEPPADAGGCLRGRVVRVHGLQSVVETDDATFDDTLRKAGVARARALVTMTASDADNLYVVTWGEVKPMSWGFYNAYADEAYAVISQDFIEANGLNPAGFDLTALEADLKEIVG